MTTMEAVTALVAEIETLTAGCLGCGEPVPADSLSDLFCASLVPYTCGWGDCDGHDPVLDTCQETALNRMATDPDDVYDDIGDELPGNWVYIGGRAGRWWPGIEDEARAPQYASTDPWTFGDGE